MERLAADRARRLCTGLSALALAGVTVLLALTLASSEFQPGLNSDLLWPQIFARDLGDPLHPVSGWKFGSASFWFPDFILFLPLYWLFGDNGFNYPLYVAGNYLLLGATMAWAMSAAGVARARAVIAAFLTLVVLLLGQFIPGHAHGLWLVGIPADHGGNLPTGFAVLALGLGAVQQGQWSRRRSTAIVAVMMLGLLSDALLLFHWIIPLALALAWQRRRVSELKPVFKGFIFRAALSLGLVIAIRIALAMAGWFFFYRLAREWPTPSLMAQTLSQFFTDLIHNGLFTHQWLFWLLAAAAGVLLLIWRRKVENSPENNAPRIALLAGGFGLVLAWVVPMATFYWHDVTSFRYLLNWVVLPGWMLALWLCRRPGPMRWLPPVAVMVGLLGAVLGFSKLDSTKLVFNCPPEAQALRDYCAKNNLTEGLSDYWREHYLRVVWGFSGPRLGQIREKDFAYFWCSNAFDYYTPAPDEQHLLPPAPQFVVLNGLDRASMTEWLGGEPLRVEQVGPYEVARLTPEQMRRAADLITTQSKEILAGRRAEWLEAKLRPAL